MRYPWNLKFWQSGEWQVCNEKLQDLEKRHVKYNPVRSDLFRSLSSVGSPSDVRVCIVGQDPYPDHRFATGLAFSIPPEYKRDDFPPTLREIFGEYKQDLRLEIPCHGNLKYWADQGVLLWNAIPVTRDGISLGCDWVEWEFLNREVFDLLSQRGIVFAFLGGVARRYEQWVDKGNCKVLVTSHPSPRANLKSKSPFRGSRIFSTINGYLNELGLDPIDWNLDEPGRQKKLQRAKLAGGDVLQNVTGADLGGQPWRPTPNLYVPGAS